MRTLVREDRVGQSARVPAVSPDAAPGSDDWWREPLNASKWEMPPKMNSPDALSIVRAGEDYPVGRLHVEAQQWVTSGAVLIAREA